MPADLGPIQEARRRRLRADCERCFALCCVVPAFSASADFALDKEAGQPCPILGTDFRCRIHDRLREQGFPGCAAYDCFGAGQHVAQVVFGGRDWRRTPEIAEEMFGVFPVVRQLHELLWYLTEALALPAGTPIHAELSRALDETERLTSAGPEALLALDVASHRRDVTALLLRTSELARAGARRRDVDHSGADLIGRDLRGADLSGATLRGAYLLGADLSGADLSSADLLGADLRGADLSAATLTGCLFLIQSQLDAARGNLRTRLPSALHHPPHWLPATRPSRGGGGI